MLDYNHVENKFNNYLSSCYQHAKDICGYSEIIKNNALLYEKKVSLISSSYRHSLRVVNGLLKLNKHLKLSECNEDFLKVIGLIHDYGKYKQAIIHTSLNDAEVYKNKGIKNHAEYGYLLLEEKHGFERLGIEEKYQPVIGTCIAYHHKEDIPKIFTNEVVELLQNKDFESLIKGNYDFNSDEINILALLLQMLTDVDKIDVLYQRAIGEIKPIKNYNIKNSEMSFENLAVSQDFKEKIFLGEEITIQELRNYENYNFVYTLWWTISSILRNLNFTGSLKIIENQKILDKIYARYPKAYYPLINEIFSFAEVKLIEEKIKLNKDNIYIRKKERK